MRLTGLVKYLNKLNINSDYTINTDSTQGDDVIGFEQLSIQWTENGIKKLIQVYPETTNMNIKRWKIWICASVDVNSQRQTWKETIYSNKSKSNLSSAAPDVIVKGIKKLELISREDIIK